MNDEFVERHSPKFYELVEQYNAALAAELGKVGVTVQRISFLSSVGRPTLTPAAIDLLTKRLFERNYFPPSIEDGFRGSIALALAVKGALRYFDEYVREYEAEPVKVANYGHIASAKEALASLISSLCRLDKKRLPDLLKLLRNKKNGDSRGYFIYALYKMGFDDYIKEFLNDPGVQPAAQIYLDKRRKNAEKRAKRLKDS